MAMPDPRTALTWVLIAIVFACVGVDVWVFWSIG
jgi:hypothetical protein